MWMITSKCETQNGKCFKAFCLIRHCLITSVKLEGVKRTTKSLRKWLVHVRLIVIYKGKVRRTGFIHNIHNISVRRYFLTFGRMPSSSMKAAQTFIHEEPRGVFVVAR